VSPHSGQMIHNAFLIVQMFLKLLSDLSNTMTSFHSIIFEISFSNVIFGNCRHRDCSMASFAILFNLSNFFSFRSLIIDLSLGRKNIFLIHISLSFWTIVSILSRLFDMAIAIQVSFICSGCSIDSTIFQKIFLSSRFEIFSLYLAFPFCTKNESQIFILKTFLTCESISISDIFIDSHFFSKFVINNCMEIMKN
jgi:hypothetical protein